MRHGARRNVISILGRTQTGTDRLNAPIYAWAAVYEDIFCSVEARRGVEQFDPVTQQRYSQTVYHFGCLYSDTIGVTTEMRILFEGQTYNIVNVLPDHQRRDSCLIEATLQDSEVGE